MDTLSPLRTQDRLTSQGPLSSTPTEARCEQFPVHMAPACPRAVGANTPQQTRGSPSRRVREDRARTIQVLTCVSGAG